MKILHIITDLDMGGAEMMLYRLLSRCDRNSFQPTVISLMDRGTLGDRIADLDIPVHTLNLNPKAPSWKAIATLLKLVRQIQPEIIQGWMYHANLAAYLATSFYHKPCIWCIHNSLYSLEYEKKRTTAIALLSSLLSHFISQIIFVSQTSHSQHLDIGYSRKKSLVIPNGINTALFVPSSDARKSIREELGLSENSLLIGAIARFHPQKDHQNFLQAAALLLQNQGDRDLHFLLCGQGCDRTNLTLTQLIEELNLTDRVYLLGQRDDIPKIMAALDIATSSSFTEALPNVIAEAMSCGVPSVVTDVGDCAKLVSNTGKIVPPKNSAALAQAWEELLNLGDEERINLGQLARERIEKSFSLEIAVQKYEKLYQK
ncbi:glycosyltransferase family 4 protein [Spirulina sp. 06S082]|uniref:glycosyltransferase family 4 protein n=1 Tax=Spirulina sp. 06S082 TaxID=3110248 RepID=UPI002B21A401|nr:glycosyltransferase [Spirulina sp. 06S082]MEA5470687.1 glycosyltransferase [Spirulina sp. 06S082]